VGVPEAEELINSALNDQAAVVFDFSGDPGITGITSADLFDEYVAGVFAQAGVGVDVVFAHASIHLSPYVLAELAETTGYNNGLISVGITTVRDAEDANTLASVWVSIAVDGIPVEELEAYFTVSVPLTDTEIDGRNTYRIIAIRDGVNIGGLYSAQTGVFTFSARATGEYTIAYVQQLRRLTLGLYSPIVTDLAGNAPQQVMDTLPVIVGIRTLVPIRFIAQALGAEVDWVAPTDTTPATAIIILDGRELRIPLDGTITPELLSLGMDVPAQIMGVRTMMPLRFISEFFGAIVEWDYDTRSIKIIYMP
jgi:hypothetical protein